MKKPINIFSISAILSSFIGVGLGVFDFLADFSKFDDSRIGRARYWCAAFLPPLCLSVIYPLALLNAIGYAGAITTIWAYIIPAVLAYRVRQKPSINSFKVGAGAPLVITIILFGILTTLFHFLAMFNRFPY